MDRRKVLKNMSLSLGFAVSAPTMLSVFQSCTTNVATWTPTFFTKTEGYMITQLSDIILPKTDIAGALDVRVPEFMDKMFNEIVEGSEKSTMKEGATAFANEFNNVFGKEAINGSKEDYDVLHAGNPVDGGRAAWNTMSASATVRVIDRVPTESEAVSVKLGNLKTALSTDVEYLRVKRPT